MVTNDFVKELFVFVSLKDEEKNINEMKDKLFFLLKCLKT